MIAKKISGWYYDLQLENRLTCATLHPSKVLINNKDWVKYSDGENMDEESKQPDPDNGNYSKVPICSAIITEDFNVSVANSWSAFGGDMLGQMWESVKPLAPYVGVFSNMIHDAVTDYKNASANDKRVIQESTISSTFASLMSSIDKFSQKNGKNITEFLNRSLVVQGTRFSYYSGSGTSFGNLVMKFTVFPKYDKKGNFITVEEQIKKILPYCIGKYITGADGLEFEDSKGNKDTKTKNLVDNMIGWQKPPGGFESYLLDVNVDQPGTLMLRFGTFYCITNLVVENANFNFSKQMVKKPDANLSSATLQNRDYSNDDEYMAAVESDSGFIYNALHGGNKTNSANDSSRILSPLYCDVTIQLRPASKYADDKLGEFISSSASRNVLNSVEKELINNLESKGEQSGFSIADYVY